MCGRYSFSVQATVLTAQFEGLEIPPQLEINYNVAPTQQAYVITDDTPGMLQSFRWGLVPFWAKDLKTGSRMINARSETILEKPAFRQAAIKRHCWVLADSFYEWKKENGQKIPYRIFLKNETVMVMAGIWETWFSENAAKPIYTFSVITCPPNEEMIPIHNRMPVILESKELQKSWLEAKDPERIEQILQTPSSGLLDMYSVSTRVNSVRNNGPGLHERIGEQGNLFK